MTRRSPDDLVRAWVRSGPETAAGDFVERTLAPIPHMRQRGRWRIRLEALPAGPRELGVRLAAAAAVVIVLVAGVALLPGIGGPGPSPSPSRPTFELRLVGSLGDGTYRADPAALTNVCAEAPDGSWRLVYGDPGVTVDMLVGAGARAPGGSAQVAAEIETPSAYVRFDPAIMRGGDPPGRSTASVSVEDVGGATRFAITATTPDRTTGTDGAAVHVELTVVCPD